MSEPANYPAGKLAIANRMGIEMEVDAEFVTPHLAVHEAIVTGWCVTHVPSGRKLHRVYFDSREGALEYAQRVVGSGLDLSFESIDEVSDDARSILYDLYSTAHDGERA